MSDGSFFESGHHGHSMIQVESDINVASGLPNVAYTDRDFWLF